MRIVSTFAVLLLWGPAVLAQHGPWIAADIESHFGEVVITSDSGRVLVMLDSVLDATHDADGVTDHWFVLQAYEPVYVADHFARALVVLSGTPLRVSATSGQRYEFAVSDTRHDVERSGNFTRVLGYGLSRFASWNPKIPLDGDPFATVSKTWGCDVFAYGEACLSGGSGATQCSSENGGFACAVACASGYEACCGGRRGAICGCEKAATRRAANGR